MKPACLDSSAWIEITHNGPNARTFLKAAHDINRVIVSTITLYEVWKYTVTHADETRAQHLVDLLQQGIVIPPDTAISIAAAMKGETVTTAGILIEDARQQRAATLLTNVAYVIEAHFEILDFRFDKNGPELPAKDCEGKHLDMFNRRARAGQCFHQPCLGNREFPARFTLIEDGDSTPPCELPPEQINKELGWMLHDIAYLPADKTAKDSFLTGRGKRVRAEPRFFNAKLENGILTVPPFHTANA